MTNRILEFEAGYQKRRAAAAAGMAKQAPADRPTQPPAQPSSTERTDSEKRDPVYNDRDAVAEGLAAGRAGVPSLANPYPITGENGVRWHAAWMDARVATESASP